MTDTVETSTLGLEFYAQLSLEILGVDALKELAEGFELYRLIAGIALINDCTFRNFNAGSIK
jgi:hypothetical protein